MARKLRESTCCCFPSVKVRWRKYRRFFIWACGHSLSPEKRHKIAHCVNYRFSSECVPLYTTVAHWHCPWVLCTGRVATHDFLGQEAVQVHPGFTSTFHVYSLHPFAHIFHSNTLQCIVFTCSCYLVCRRHLERKYSTLIPLSALIKVGHQRHPALSLVGQPISG